MLVIFLGLYRNTDHPETCNPCSQGRPCKILEQYLIGTLRGLGGLNAHNKDLIRHIKVLKEV